MLVLLIQEVSCNARIQEGYVPTIKHKYDTYSKGMLCWKASNNSMNQMFFLLLCPDYYSINKNLFNQQYTATNLWLFVQRNIEDGIALPKSLSNDLSFSINLACSQDLSEIICIWRFFWGHCSNLPVDCHHMKLEKNKRQTTILRNDFH